MSWFRKIWPKRAKAKSKPEFGGALASSYAQDLQSPDELINRATKRALRGDIEGAIADFDAAIELNPTRATTFYSRAYLHNLAGNYRQAIVDCSEAIALLPDYDEAFYQRGIAHLELDNPEAAVADLSEVLRLNPFSIKTYYKRANCYAAQDDIQGAVADYTQAILRVPKDAKAYVQRGLFLIKLQEYRTAIEDFSSALSMNPRSAAAYYHRGYCYAELGQKERATQDFNQAMLYDPNQRVADYNRSYALGILREAKQLPPAQPSVSDEDPSVLQGDESAASTVLRDQASTPRSSRHARVERERTVELTQVEQDERPATVPTASGRGQRDLHFLLEQGRQKAEAGDHAGAARTYSQILASDPDYAQAYLERGKSLTVLGEMDRAADDLEAAIRCAKQKSLTLMKDYSGTLSETLADLKVELSQDQDASSSSLADNQSIEAEILKYSKAIHRNPLDATAYFERAKSRALLGDLDGAIADYTRTISLDAQHPEAYYKRGMLLEALGDEEGATQDLNRAIRRTPLLLPPTPSGHSSTGQSSDQEIELASAEMAKDEDVATSELDEPNPARTSPYQSPLMEDMSSPLPPEKTPNHADDEREETSNVEESGSVLNARSLILERFRTLLQSDDALSDDVPTYFSDLVLEPCAHEGNDPVNRFCVHCGQPIQPNSVSSEDESETC